MGFLDQKERILDIVLTDKGRELLSKNQLRFKYYAFSDEGVNYSGSLSSSVVLSSSVDNVVKNNLVFEANQRKDSDLRSFLYTIDPYKKVLPQFSVNVSLTSALEVERRYEIKTIDLSTPVITRTKNPLAVIARVTVEKETPKERKEAYIRKQKSKSAFPLKGGKDK